MSVEVVGVSRSKMLFALEKAAQLNFSETCLRAVFERAVKRYKEPEDGEQLWQRVKNLCLLDVQTILAVAHAHHVLFGFSDKVITDLRQKSSRNSINLLFYEGHVEINWKFSRREIRECVFNETALVGAKFCEADLKGTIFHRADLSKADFRGAINYAISPEGNKIKKAKFSIPEVLALLAGFDIELE